MRRTESDGNIRELLRPASARGSLDARAVERVLERAPSVPPPLSDENDLPSLQGGSGAQIRALHLWSPGAERRPVQALSERVLQRLRFADPRGAPDMACRFLGGAALVDEAGRLRMARDARVSLNTYLGSFYENYWARHAPLGDLGLVLFGVGEVDVQAFRRSAEGKIRRIGRACLTLNEEEGARLPIPPEPYVATAGRVYLELRALSDIAVVAEGRFEAGTPPRRPVRLGIGLCTFNREAMLAENLRRIVESPHYAWGRPRLFVVNQGRPFGTPEMLALLARHSEQVTVIEQANLGGAGGFTRAAMEIVREGSSTHVLFMDDDIEVDPDVLIATHAFAARALKPIVVGGAMVDLYRPSVMYEAGTIVGADNILRALLHDEPLQKPATLDQMAREVPCHFNGWWYCAIPVEAFREHGLPLPIFIRGDDMEYGTRLMRRGMSTVVLPPLSVWHEPFYAKPPSWQLYYDLRNRLIFASLYPDFVRLDPWTVIVRRLIDCLLKHDYMHAALVIRAAEDFLRGPEALDTPMDELHREITALANAYAPGKLDTEVGLVARPWRKPVQGPLRQATLLRGLLDLIRGRISDRLRPEIIYRDQWHPWMTMPVAQYALCDRALSYIQVYRYDRDRLRAQLRQGLDLVGRFRRGAQPAASRWRAAQPDLVSWDRWDRILGLGQDRIGR